MPTTDRPELVGMAIDCWREQSYPRDKRELVIVNSGAPLPEEMRAGTRYQETYRERGVGDMFELAIAAATGDLLMFWADDDWHHPDRILAQVSLLLEKGRDVTYCGINPIYYCDLRNGDAWLYDGSWNPIDGTALFPRSLHERRGPINNTSDNLSHLLMGEPVIAVSAPNLYIATYHGGNIWGDEIFKAKPFRHLGKPPHWPAPIEARIAKETPP